MTPPGGDLGGADDRFLSSAIVLKMAGHKKRWPAPLSLALCMATLGLVALAQQVIRTETRLVLVDAVVRDKKGKIVSDLAAGDFRLWEDGKERPIASSSLEAAGPPDQPEAQYVAFLFDSSGVSAGSRLAAEKSARQDVATFAGAYASPARYRAVVNFNGILSIAQNFTATADRVQRAAGDAATAAERGSIGPASDLGLRSGSQTPVANASEGDMVATSQVAGVQQRQLPARDPMGSQQHRDAVSNAYGDAVLRNGFPILDAIGVVADAMASIRGRKSIVILSASVPSGDIPPALQVAAAVRACNAANVAVYATNPDLKTLAEETGGRWIDNHKLVRELSEIADDQEKRYVLSFKPVESPDGSCHSLRVRTTRAGLDVRARDAYCNAKAPDLLAGKVEGKALEARAAAPSAGNAAASMALSYFYSSPGIAVVNLAMEMDLANLKFTKQNGKQHAELNLVALANGPDGEVAGRFSEAVPLDFETAQEAEAFRKQPYRYEHQFDLPSGRYNLRVAFSSGDQTFGKVEAPLTVDPWDGQRLALSGIALASESQKVSDLTSDLDPSLTEGRKRLVAKSVEVSGSGNNRFHRAAPCFAYLEIYDPPLAGPNPPTVGLAMRILDQGTGEQKQAGVVSAASFIRPGNPVVPVLLSVPIAALSPGSYRLEVKASHSPGNDSVIRTVDFRVED
jgi:VWFA-related protein